MLRSNPVIVLPGITANYLRDDYPLPPATVWSVLTNSYERASLHPDNPRYEAIEPARVQPDQLFEVVYKEMIDELRYNLSPSQVEPVPVYPFAYDWRQKLDDTEAQLGAFIKEVIARTKLMRHYARDPWNANPKVNLISHSMGGLVIAGYLEKFGSEQLVGKVATLATPYRGSYEAVIKIITGTANLGGSAPSSREREAARLTPALYHLFPRFPGALRDQTGAQMSFFDPSSWQPSIMETLQEYIRLHGLSAVDIPGQALALFNALLEGANVHRDRTAALDLAQAGLVAKDWLCVVGVDAVTRVQMKVKRLAGGTPSFDLSTGDRQNGWTPGGNSPARLQTGDGTVPFQGAVAPFLRPENLVCVTPGDFGYWEIQDRLLLSQAGFHGIMPAMNMLHRMIVMHFTGRTDTHGNVWGQPAPGTDPDSWDPPLPLPLP
jgi:pimeloyl-ACP methyl ester carboxylesterase